VEHNGERDYYYTSVGTLFKRKRDRKRKRDNNRSKASQGIDAAP
jgi:hypothetical protein